MLGVEVGVTWQSEHAVLAPGDRLFVFSDGAYELSRPDGTLLPFESFVDAVERAAAVADPLASLVEFAVGTAGVEQLDDDLSVLLLRAPAR